MSDPLHNEQAITALLNKRAELEARLQGLQSAMFHIDRSLELFGYEEGRVRQAGKRFARGELISLVGEAERLGHETAAQQAGYIISLKGWDDQDMELRRKILYSVREVRKRTSQVERMARAQK